MTHHLFRRLESSVFAQRLMMTANMTCKEIDGVSVIATNGRVVLGQESSSIRERVTRLLAEGKKRIVLNVAR